MRFSPLICLLAVTAACENADPLSSTPLPSVAQQSIEAPSDVVQVAGFTVWPYTAADLATPQDPINLVFAGGADPRAIRQALFALDGNRPEFGGVPPFDCTWQDAIGDEQGAFAEPSGWVGSAVQVACGAYGPLRFHVRLFAAGDVVLGNAHFEVLIPGTTEHQVLSWELAEQFAVYDLVRTGMLDPGQPVVPSAPISAAPTFRSIPAVIYDGLADLWTALGAPPSAVVDPMPIPNDGSASILQVAGQPAIVANARSEDFVIDFDQVIPKPFCAAGVPLVHVAGPVSLSQRVRVTSSGRYIRTFNALGRLTVTPIDPQTGRPSGASYGATVSEAHHALLDDGEAQVSSRLTQIETPPAGPARGRLSSWLRLGPAAANDVGLSERCGD